MVIGTKFAYPSILFIIFFNMSINMLIQLQNHEQFLLMIETRLEYTNIRRFH